MAPTVEKLPLSLAAKRRLWRLEADRYSEYLASPEGYEATLKCADQAPSVIRQKAVIRALIKLGADLAFAEMAARRRRGRRSH